MQGRDWMALLPASIVIAFEMYREVREVLLSDLSVAAICEKKVVPSSWLVAIEFLNLLVSEWVDDMGRSDGPFTS